MTWQEFEKYVKIIATYKWETPATAETINGVKVDCILKIRDDFWVAVEITQDESLSKLRIDLAKFATIRPYLMSQNIYAQCYFITETTPPSSLYESGKGHNVTVLSLSEFDASFFDYNSYRYARNQKKFGSAVNLTSGEKDTRKYVPVKYENITKDIHYSLEDISNALQQGHRIILLGNYGTGKSRCIQELFNTLAFLPKNKVLYPISIDLRDNWGTKRGHEIIQRHFDDLGLNDKAPQVIKLLGKASFCFLLDGFDEIGSQTWSDNPIRLGKIRSESLIGVKDLIARTKGGMIITGREHYFNSDSEMFECLGLSSDKTIMIRCADEFSDEEMSTYISEVCPSVSLPTWVPRRPFICQILIDMGQETLTAISTSGGGKTAFWESLINGLCEREARIHLALDSDTIRRVLRQLARLTRNKPQNFGPISIGEINKAFETVTGLPPVDESAVMLQRLPTLGRLATESTDRHFVDEYILDGLRAEDISNLLEDQLHEVCNVKWTNPLRSFGLSLLADTIGTAPNSTYYFRIMRQAASRQNGVLAGDILAAILESADSNINFDNLKISDSHITYMNLSSNPVSNLYLVQSVLENIDISECNISNVHIQECIINKLMGVAAKQGLPDWIEKSSVEKYEAVTTVSRIKRAPLSEEQRIFITLIKKLFFQPGAGRKEEALLRGLSSSADSKMATRLLNILMTENIVERIKGKEGWVYKPIRKHAHRMDKIITELTLSQDPLWKSLQKK